MTLIEVNNKKTRRQFLDLPKGLYRGDSNWTCLLDAEIEGIFDPQKNNNFKHGDACRWILRDQNNQTIGRIAAFYDRRKANSGSNKQATGGIGFFECINNQEAANQLFDVTKAWLASKGMEAMDGPINFGENYVHWGLLIEGFMHQAYGMPYNFPYYLTLFENYGFQTYFNQNSYHVDLTKPFPERQEKFARFVMRKPNYRFEYFRFTDYQKYLADLVQIYNEVWSDFHEDYTPLTYEEFEHVFNDAKALLNEKLIVFAYEEDRPIGMVIAFPDFNQVFKKLKNGKLNLINKLKLLYYRKRGITRARQLVSGVIPEYQKSGIIGPLFLKLTDACKALGITELEMSWVGDYNETVNKIYQLMDNATHAKTHATLRYLFDRNKPFERFTNQGAEKSQRNS
ncbi:MAG: N-acetyltransferase [Bacteroidetes bacterium HGW-Bacteroidetes-4]|nr:MAG: N-acetyltransferase [Bacteroidetes bacterium HGW-Bacteroidetes-4]